MYGASHHKASRGGQETGLVGLGWWFHQADIALLLYGIEMGQFYAESPHEQKGGCRHERTWLQLNDGLATINRGLWLPVCVARMAMGTTLDLHPTISRSMICIATVFCSRGTGSQGHHTAAKKKRCVLVDHREMPANPPKTNVCVKYIS